LKFATSKILQTEWVIIQTSWFVTSSKRALEFDVESWSICNSSTFLDFKNSEAFDLSMLENYSE
jgi:hypothetical protein